MQNKGCGFVSFLRKHNVLSIFCIQGVDPLTGNVGKPHLITNQLDKRIDYVFGFDSGMSPKNMYAC